MLHTHLTTSQELLAKLTLGIADGIDDILKHFPDSAARNSSVRKALAKQAPCPVAGAQWSLVNTFDYEFEGFASRHLTEHITNTAAKKSAHVPTTPNLLVMRDIGLAAKLAYEEASVIKYFCQQWKMDFETFFDFPVQNTQAYIMYDQQNIVLSFRGTELLNAHDWAADFQVKLTSMIAHASDGASAEMETPKVLVHSGFLSALGLKSTVTDSPFEKIYGVLSQMLAKAPRKVWITGHSLGAALASIFVAQLILDDDEILDSLAGLYTYGQPRCGDESYCKIFNDLESSGKLYRAVYKKDIVTRVPPKVLNYRHHGSKIDMVSDTSIVCGKDKDSVKINRVKTNAKASPSSKGSNLKKVVFALMPNALEDHYPSSYVRGLELFLN